MKIEVGSLVTINHYSRKSLFYSIILDYDYDIIVIKLSEGFYW